MDDELTGLDVLHNASVYLDKAFSLSMSREAAKANLDARAIIFNCSNKIFKANGIGISREEIEGAAIIESSNASRMGPELQFRDDRRWLAQVPTLRIGGHD